MTISKFQIIKNDIIKDIKEGILKPGDKVDSESKLKKKYDVSTITVRKAFTDLINEGYLYGVQGLGTFVTKKPYIRNLSSISFSEELKEQGYETGMVLDGIDEILDNEIAKILNIDPATPIYCLKRVRLANNQPVAYHISYISSTLISLEELEEVKKTRSFYETLENNMINVETVTETYSVKEVNDANICQHLKVKKGYPAFHVKRVAYDNKYEIIEYCRTYFNKDWYSVTVEITRK